MKLARSTFIESFLAHIERGDIAAVTEPGAPSMLEMMAEALRQILAGEKPDKALRIEREAGQPQDSITIPIAVYVHELRKSGIEWGAIERILEIELQEMGRKPLKKERLRAIHKANREWLEFRDEQAKFAAEFHKRIPNEKE